VTFEGQQNLYQHEASHNCFATAELLKLAVVNCHFISLPIP